MTRRVRSSRAVSKLAPKRVNKQVYEFIRELRRSAFWGAIDNKHDIADPDQEPDKWSLDIQPGGHATSRTTCTKCHKAVEVASNAGHGPENQRTNVYGQLIHQPCWKK